MIADAIDLPLRAEVRADICIVGSGAAGITLALKLLASGKTILLLESSAKDVIRTMPHQTARKLHASGVPLEFGFLRANRLYDPDAQQLNGGSVSAEMAAFDPQFLKWSRLRAYGGTTNCWSGTTRPLDAIDFERHDLGLAWPISREALYPHYYNEAMQMCSMRGIGVERYDDEASWARSKFLDVAGVTGGAMRNAIFLAVNERAWGFQHVWGPALERAPNCQILRNANVRAIAAGAAGRSVDHLLVSSIAGRKHSADFIVKADQYVLATGGTEGPRLLMHSADGGFANRHGWLGRCFQIHPLNGAFATFQHGKRRASQEIIESYSQMTTLDGEMSPSIQLMVAPSEATLRHRRMRNFRAMIRFDLGRINLNWEQAPNPDSRILLSKTEKDSIFGDPLAHLEWRSTPDDTNYTPDKALRLVTDLLNELDLARQVTRTGAAITWAGDHHMGATRMSARPEDGYVDPNCRVHGVDNLYIASSSVFPTSGYANPTLTIIALAARLADHIAERCGSRLRGTAPN